VDEAGSTTQSPFITAPQLRDSDPDVDDNGAVLDNSSMSSSRTRSGSSRSGSTGAGASRTQTTPRADVNAATGKDDAKSEAAAEPDSEAAKPATSAPMPSDGIRPSFTPTAATTAAPSTQSAAKSAPSTPSAPQASPQPAPKPAPVTPSAPPTQSSSSAPSTSASPVSSGYQGSGYQQPSPYSQPNYARSSWSSSPATSGTTTTADSAGFSAPASTVGPAVANGSQAAPSNGGFSAPAAGAAAGLGGAAAGLASSVTAAFRGGSGTKAQAAPKPQSAPKVKVRRSNKRQAMLTLSRMEPWSVMKFSFVASVVAFIILFVAVAVLYMVLSALGVFTSLENQVASITSAKNAAGTNISHWFSASLILGWTALLGALNIVLITALSTIGSVIYNLIAKTVGGIEVTLRETD